MIKYFSRAFKITNENLILTTPFIFFRLLLSVYLKFVGNASQPVIISLLFLLTILFLFGIFFAGWFFMTQKAIELDKKEIADDEERSKLSFGLLKEFPAGVGEYFLSFVGLVFLYFILAALFMFAFYKFGVHFIGKVDLSFPELNNALSSASQMREFKASLSSMESSRINLWSLLIVFGMGLFSFITMIWPAQIINEDKNPLSAFFKSLKLLFKNFPSSLIVFLYISFVNFLVSASGAFASINPIVYFISTVLYFYFAVYIVVLVFLYYDGIKQQKIENNCADNCDCGADSFGQE